MIGKRSTFGLRHRAFGFRLLAPESISGDQLTTKRIPGAGVSRGTRHCLKSGDPSPILFS